VKEPIAMGAILPWVLAAGGIGVGAGIAVVVLLKSRRRRGASPPMDKGGT
jgi:hypothetical protein